MSGKINKWFYLLFVVVVELLLSSLEISMSNCYNAFVVLVRYCCHYFLRFYNDLFDDYN